MTTQLKIEAGKKYRTRGGDEVEVLRTDVNSDESVVGIVTHKDDGSQWVAAYFSDGRYFLYGDSPADLISEIKPKQVMWANVYVCPAFDTHHSSREDADKYAGTGRIARVRVEFEEGQFDE